MAALLDHFKTELGENYHLMPLVKKTTSSLLDPEVRIGILLEWYREQGEAGMAQWCFGAKDGDRAKASDFQIPIPKKVLEVQLG